MPVKTLGSDPTSMGERNEGRRGHWVSKGVDCDVPHWLEICDVHIGWGREQNSYNKGVKLFPTTHFKTSKGSLKKTRQYLIAVDLDG